MKIEKTFSIPGNKIDAFEYKMAQIERKAKKTKVSFSYKRVGEEYACEYTDQYRNTFTYTRQDYFVYGELPIIEGYQVIGVKDYANGVIHIVREEVPEYLWNFDNYCDHCKTVRRRNKSFILKDENNNYIQVGKTCLKDYDPNYANKIAYFETFIYFLDNEVDEGEYSESEENCRAAKTIAIRNYLAQEVHWLRDHEYISKSRGERDLLYPTAHAIYDVFHDEKFNPEKLSDSDFEKADKMIEFLKNRKPETTYEFSLKSLCINGFVKLSNAGYVASIPLFYDKETEKLNVQRESEYVGNVGDKIEIEVTLKAIYGFETTYGWKQILSFRDNNGNVIVWKTTSGAPCEKDETVTLRGTVKEHTIYRDIKQTILTRCRVK